MTRIYVGNLPFSASEDDVRSLFTEYGSVEDVSLVSDRETGRPRGFGFVEMDNQGANAAIQALDGLEYGGRNLRVNEARPREERPPRRDGGGYGGGRGGGGGYGRDRDRGGSGLGLAITKALGAAHGGHIAATSAGPGTGTTFTITLPGR